jgi:aspartyl-tRNA(Asn)/glutamyl-tRNA(Gln) amidotransferase subunit A
VSAAGVQWLGIAEAGALLRARELSVAELVGGVLDWIERCEPRVGAYVALAADDAREQARRCDAELAAGIDRGPLHGIPYSAKDLIAVAGLPLRAGSRATGATIPIRDAAVVAAVRAAGAICLGKVATHEFAWGMLSDPARNPHDPARVAGGSSGGSAAAVAAGEGMFSLGTDCGCSIRAPAALNGVCGLRPTHGRVSTDGCIPLSMTMDTTGPLARSVADLAPVLDAIAGAAAAPFGARLGRPVAGLRVGVPADHFFDDIQPGVEAAVRAALDVLADLGCELVGVRLPHARLAGAADVAIVTAENAALMRDLEADRGELLGADVRAQLAVGNAMPAVEYLRAQQVRALIADEWDALLREQVDVIVCPAVPAVAQRHSGTLDVPVTYPGGLTEDIGWSYCRYTFPMSLAGLPTLAVPCGAVDGLPAGVQITGPAFGEALVLQVGDALARALALDMRPAALLQAVAA